MDHDLIVVQLWPVQNTKKYEEPLKTLGGPAYFLLLFFFFFASFYTFLACFQLKQNQRHLFVFFFSIKFLFVLFLIFAIILFVIHKFLMNCNSAAIKNKNDVLFRKNLFQSAKISFDFAKKYKNHVPLCTYI